MAKAGKSAREIRFCVIHDGVQPGPPLPEQLAFGLQDTKGELQSGVRQADGGLRFDFTLSVGSDAPVFAGRFAHGPLTARFLYLSWKRIIAAPHPFGWRIKIPLIGIGWGEIEAASKPSTCLLTNAIGRRPHATAPIIWQIGVP